MRGSYSGTTAHKPLFPLTPHASSKYLVTPWGEPFLMVADSAWDLIVGPTTADAQLYLNDRATRGFNTLIVQVIDIDYTAHTPASANNAGQVPFTSNNDFATIQSNYFDHALAIVQAAQALGFLVLLVPAYIGSSTLINGNPQGWITPMVNNGVTKCQNYGAYLGTLFANTPNIIWVHGGDNVPTTTGSPSQRDVVNAVATGILSTDVAGRLHSAHWGGREISTDVASLSFTVGLDGVDTDQVAVECARARTGDNGVRPYTLLEDIYEFEHSSTNATLRAQMHQAMLGGGCGVMLGVNPVWFFGTPGDGGSGWAFNSAGSNVAWKDALASRGTLDAQVARNFYSIRRWTQLTPDSGNTFLTNGASYTGTNFAPAALAFDGTWGAVYVPINESLTIDKSKLARTSKGYWLDPTNGATQSLGNFAPSGSQSFSTPGNNNQSDPDWLLVFEAL